MLVANKLIMSQQCTAVGKGQAALWGQRCDHPILLITSIHGMVWGCEGPWRTSSSNPPAMGRNTFHYNLWKEPGAHNCKKAAERQESVQRKDMKMTKGLENLPCEEALKELDILSLENRGLGGTSS
ncbi:hypothetical protein WISP_85114 [Willisornis vidua]|uniref:Uncharacterized protein n=1 Tax=Willisornis vidua TaxID=1566151 RepID=A0ABQ9D4G0_9PASS|nr:hypothetical protein WISP_85114 [Willisornis vidua]